MQINPKTVLAAIKPAIQERYYSNHNYYQILEKLLTFLRLHSGTREAKKMHRQAET